MEPNRGDVVGSARQSIGLAIVGTLAIGDVVVVGSEGGGPSGMSCGCCLGLGEILQILVVSVDLDRMSCSLDGDPPLFESCYHR